MVGTPCQENYRGLRGSFIGGLLGAAINIEDRRAMQRMDMGLHRRIPQWSLLLSLYELQSRLFGWQKRHGSYIRPLARAARKVRSRSLLVPPASVVA